MWLMFFVFLFFHVGFAEVLIADDDDHKKLDAFKGANR